MHTVGPKENFYFDLDALEEDFRTDPKAFEGARTFVFAPYAQPAGTLEDLDERLKWTFGALEGPSGGEESKVSVSKEIPLLNKPRKEPSYSSINDLVQPSAHPLELSNRDAKVLDRCAELEERMAPRDRRQDANLAQSLEKTNVPEELPKESVDVAIENKDHPTNMKIFVIFSCFVVLTLSLSLFIICPASIGFVAAGALGAKIGGGLGLAAYVSEIFLATQKGWTIYNYLKAEELKESQESKKLKEPQTFISSTHPFPLEPDSPPPILVPDEDPLMRPTKKKVSVIFNDFTPSGKSKKQKPKKSVMNYQFPVPTRSISEGLSDSPTDLENLPDPRDVFTV